MSLVVSVIFALACLVASLGGARVTSAQGVDTSIFAPLTLGPAPGRTRLANGAPGPGYWQNRASYDLKATLDTAAHVVRGSMVLRYTNNSSNTLDVLWVQTEQDPYERVESFTQVVNGKPVLLKLENYITETKVFLAEPIKPGATVTFRAAWQFVMPPDKGRGRMGWEGKLYEIGQWYPRVNVYDDVKGWNTESYMTGGEFYLEYGDYTLDVTVPAGYIVAATGTLDNPRDVLTPTEITRLAAAAKADTVVRVVTAAELQSGAARPKTAGTLTWKYHAKNVRDAVWCAAPDYQWDATSWNGILAQAYYRPTEAAIWNDAADMARMSIREYSGQWFPYPYPQISVTEGPVGGMEYPMLSMVTSVDRPPVFFDVLTHEVGHEWFPIVVGSNERAHAWMDEGFNQFINTFTDALRFPVQGDQNARAGADIATIERRLKKHQSRALENGTDIGKEGEEYVKTAAGLQMLRRDILGPAVFDKGMRAYVRHWAYKHPTPVDFFRTMEDVSGRKLDWFWRGWFLEAPVFDQAIDSVRRTARGNGTDVTVTYRNKGRGVLPLLVRFTFSDSSAQDFTYPAEVWKTHGTTYTVSYAFPGKIPVRIALDPDAHIVDIDRSNNLWEAR